MAERKSCIGSPSLEAKRRRALEPPIGMSSTPATFSVSLPPAGPLLAEGNKKV